MRDAMSEAAFFPTYGNVFSLYVADKQERAGAARADRRAARAAVRAGGAGLDRRGRLCRGARARRCLLARKGEPLPLSRLQLKQELMAEYEDLLPGMPPDQWRRIRGEQEIIVRYEPERAIDDAAAAAARSRPTASAW